MNMIDVHALIFSETIGFDHLIIYIQFFFLY